METKRICPNCSGHTVPVTQLLFSSFLCPECGAFVKAHRFYGVLFNLVTLAVTALSTLVIFADLGLYAALLMLPLPLGAFGYIKARFCPLVAKGQ
jgi:hypothetical protein